MPPCASGSTAFRRQGREHGQSAAARSRTHARPASASGARGDRGAQGGTLHCAGGAAREYGVPIIWGGDWASFPDGPHFELDRVKYP
ncbi:MAG: M15 family metallopeptidase [Roseomonas sp.]|nr:M15 family metallopeptidase [Roseomonas sp.]